MKRDDYQKFIGVYKFLGCGQFKPWEEKAMRQQIVVELNIPEEFEPTAEYRQVEHGEWCCQYQQAQRC